ncbi:MAG TPA: septal ring lytic transglycosylase RlpA family protein [Terriglobales bacterium]|nr:septal ring lytic transglycosylase RlpA family protein [Terriglobales bacterium]
MRRLLTYLLAVPVMAATVGAAPAANTPNLAVATNSPKQFKNTTVNSSKQKRKPSKPYQIGTASWYGRQFHGKTTASGEPFNMFNLTAAHRTLKLGTWVKVTNMRNGASVIVRINDRGPVPESRIIDLSYEAATMLDLRAYGLQKVRLDIADPETVASALRAEQVN